MFGGKYCVCECIGIGVVDQLQYFVLLVVLVDVYCQYWFEDFVFYQGMVWVFDFDDGGFDEIVLVVIILFVDQDFGLGIFMGVVDVVVNVVEGVFVDYGIYEIVEVVDVVYFD